MTSWLARAMVLMLAFDLVACTGSGVDADGHGGRDREPADSEATPEQPTNPNGAPSTETTSA